MVVAAGFGLYAAGHLSVHANESHLKSIIGFLTGKLKENLSNTDYRTYIQSIGILTRYVGPFVGKHLDVLFPLIVRHCNGSEDELRETCIQSFELFCLRCPKEVKPFIKDIVSICVTYIKYDPNYNYDDENGDGDEGSEMDTDGEEDDDEDDDVYSDDDDMSWKVRRASAKCFAAVINTRSEMLCDIYREISPLLIARFKEREENVQLEIFNAYFCLLKQTKFLSSQTIGKNDETPAVTNELLTLLYNEVPSLVKALRKQLKQKSVKVRQNCFSILSELVSALPGVLAAHISDLIPGIEFSLNDRVSNSNLKIETLVFLSTLFTTHEASIFQQNHVAAFVKLTISAISDPFYKIASEGLNVCSVLVKVIRPVDLSQSFDYNPFVKPLYDAAFPKLQAMDIDHEVKERSIICVATIIATFADVLKREQLDPCLPIYLERLKNEITRLIATKGLIVIARSPYNIVIPLVNEVVLEMSSFLRKNSRPLKLAALSGLDTFVARYGKADYFNCHNYEVLASELVAMINDTDLHITQLALSLLSTIIKSSPGSVKGIIEGPNSCVLAELKRLIQSALLQGAALEALCDVLKDLLSVSFESQEQISSIQYKNLVKSLLDPIYDFDSSAQGQALALSKQGFYSTAKIIAVLTLSCPGEGIELINKLLEGINENSSESVNLICLLVLGNIGRSLDLSSYSSLQNVIMDAFKSSSEDVKSAASFAFGNICVGNLEFYLPILVEQIKSHGKQQYLLLHSLKEAISTEALSEEGMAKLHKHIEEIWGLLFNHCESKEEGTRNVVAECLGKLTVMNPELLLVELRKRLSSPSEFTRGIVAAAVKFTISEKPSPIDNMLRACFGEFMRLLKDESLNVRRLALVAFNNAAHSKPSLVRDLLPELLPSIYVETEIRKELIRRVQMGPFQHVVDDGLEIRKVAFECMYTMLDTCLDRIDIFDFLNHVQKGLEDEDDVKMLNQIMLVRLCTVAPHALLQRLDALIPPLQATITKDVKSTAVKQEVEKNEEMIKSALRAINCLMKVPESDMNPNFHKFCVRIRNHPGLNSMMDSIQRDETQRVAVADVMDLS